MKGRCWSGMSNVKKSYLLGLQDGQDDASHTRVDSSTAALILLALVEQDPSVTVELPAPDSADIDYTKGYVKGWERRIVARSRRLVE